MCVPSAVVNSSHCYISLVSHPDPPEYLHLLLSHLMHRHVSLDCIRNFYSDGSSQVRGALCADNGLVYKIERVLAFDEGPRGAARSDGSSAAAPATGA